jgi:2-hydroxycyclohexanecarboxyl-CoA dehydrogenase
MDLGLSDRVVLVTGAGRGIGKQIGVALAEEGARVAVNDLFQERADETAAAIVARGGRAIGVAADVTDMDAVVAAVTRISTELGPIDVLVNNAGIAATTDTRGVSSSSDGAFGRSSRAEWDRTTGIITYGVLNCTRAVIKSMMDRRWGRIVNIVSDAGRVGEPRLAAYSMAKAGVIGFSKALAKELGRFCITVNCVSPATTETESTAELLLTEGEQIMRAYPLAKGLNRLGRPDDVANAVAFLASVRAEWITGQVLSVNGGYSMVG